MDDVLRLANPITPQDYLPLVEDEDNFFGDSSSVATVTDDQTDELDILLGKSFNVDEIVSRVHEPNRTPIDFARMESVEDSESFDGADSILDSVETPEVPTYVPENEPRSKSELARDLAKSAHSACQPGKCRCGENTRKVEDGGSWIREYDETGSLIRAYAKDA
jgi:hypothetical protein